MIPVPDSLIQKYNVPAPRYTSYPTEDILNKKLILNLICNQETKWNDVFYSKLSTSTREKLNCFMEENLIDMDVHGMQIKKAGLPFVRNICMIFDQ